MTLREKLEQLRQDIDMRQERIEPTGRELAIFALIDVALAADDLSFHDIGPLEDALSDALSRLDKELG